MMVVGGLNSIVLNSHRVVAVKLVVDWYYRSADDMYAQCSS